MRSTSATLASLLILSSSYLPAPTSANPLPEPTAPPIRRPSTPVHSSNPARRSAAPESGLSMPINHNRGYMSKRTSPNLETRQEWLKTEARKMKRKYAEHLTVEEREVMFRRGELGRRSTDVDSDFNSDSASSISLSKRSNDTGAVTLTDIGYDASYSGALTIGTPAQSFQVVLDTGSADFWLAGSGCTSTTCSGISLFDTSTSSSYASTGESFNITYGSGEASGTLATDTVTMGNYTVDKQTFAVVTTASDGLLTSPYSGLMGLGWQSLATSGATPFWEALAASGSWSTLAFTFFLERYRDDYSAAEVESDGGLFTMGYLNESLYTGDVNYISISTADQDYWRIDVSGATCQSTTVDITQSGSTPMAAIDSGTTLIGAPTAAVEAFYATISDSAALTGDYAGYYQYPCSTTVKSSLQFGGVSYSISDADFNLGSFTSDSTMCTGAVYAQDLSSSSPISWIVGDTFMKNVYTVFRYNPSAVGFAALSSNASTVTTASDYTSSTGASSAASTGSSSSAGSKEATVLSGMAMIGTVMLGAYLAL